MREVPAQRTAPTRLAKSFTLAAMSLGYGVVQLDVTIVNTELNSIDTSLGGGVSELQWVVSNTRSRLPPSS
jgi:DHA2 family methylenomycin A resistance protein-like MFS transporter